MNIVTSMLQVMPLPLVVAIAAAAAALLLLTIYRTVTIFATGPGTPETKKQRQTMLNLATGVVASAATALSAQTLWLFAEHSLGLTGPWRVLPTVALDTGVVALAILSRQRVTDSHSQGLPGALMWAIAGFSGVLGITEADGVGEGLARFVWPLFAAVLWHLGSIEKQRRLQRGGRPDRRIGAVRWLHPVERVRVMAELATDTDMGEREATSRVRVAAAARAVDRYARLMESSGASSWRSAVARRGARNSAHRAGMRNSETGSAVVGEIAILRGIDSLARDGVVPDAPVQRTPREHNSGVFANTSEHPTGGAPANTCEQAPGGDREQTTNRVPGTHEQVFANTSEQGPANSGAIGGPAANSSREHTVDFPANNGGTVRGVDGDPSTNGANSIGEQSANGSPELSRTDAVNSRTSLNEYVELAREHVTANSGVVPGVRELARIVGCSVSTASKIRNALQERN